MLHRAGLRQVPTAHEEDVVGVADGVQAVGDDHLGGRRRQLVQHLFQQLLGHRVDIGRGLVEDQDLRLAQHRAQEGDQLLLAQRQALAPGLDRRRQALVEARDEGG